MMIIAEIIRVAKDYYTPAGTIIDGYSLKDKPIEEFIQNLSENDITINPAYSTKEVQYYVRTVPNASSKKTSLVPLTTIFPNDAAVTPLAFYLRNGKGLELTLCDYDHRTMQPSPGRIGGPIAGQSGIECIVLCNAKIADTSIIIDTVKKALKKTYLRDHENDFIDLLSSIENSVD
ncbi:MAG: hypothetical protein Q8R37_04165 [Nanoarchaeota archaeon]|nr:hypothetical protein [Nanoarchaeota archaeon]